MLFKRRITCLHNQNLFWLSKPVETETIHSVFSNSAFGLPIFTVRKRSCGKIMFSQACVKNSDHGGRCTPPLGRQADNPLGRHPHGQHPPMGRHPPGRQVDTPLGRHPLGQTSTQADTPPTSDGHCSGRYASYWKAFLFIQIFSY